MSLNRLFDTIEKARETAHWRAAFGEPTVIEDKTLIPVSQVGYGFGLGFGQGGPPPEEGGEAAPEAEGGETAPGGEGGGVGGAASSKPLGIIVVSPDGVRFQEVEDEGKIALAGILLGGLSVYQVAKTLREIFGRG
jgi:uncharacterized spore protein YtfJ